jgi:hypothetical protein
VDSNLISQNRDNIEKGIGMPIKPAEGINQQAKTP